MNSWNSILNRSRPLPHPSQFDSNHRIIQPVAPHYTTELFRFFSTLCKVKALGYGWAIGVLGFDSRRGLGTFLFTTASRTALGLTQPPIQWIAGALSLGVKRPGREADHSPPSRAEVKECVELYLYSPNTLSWCCA
jgi:hypothetical protein